MKCKEWQEIRKKFKRNFRFRKGLKNRLPASTPRYRLPAPAQTWKKPKITRLTIPWWVSGSWFNIWFNIWSNIYITTKWQLFFRCNFWTLKTFEIFGYKFVILIIFLDFARSRLEPVEGRGTPTPKKSGLMGHKTPNLGVLRKIGYCLKFWGKIWQDFD